MKYHHFWMGMLGLLLVTLGWAGDEAPFRSSPLKSLTEAEAQQMLIEKGLFDFRLNQDGSGIVNRYEVQEGGLVVLDKATGLMWQRSGSQYRMFYTSARLYIDSLNQVAFAGYDDWRLPTLEEAMTLMEPRNNGFLYIDSIFDPEQWWILTADQDGKDWAWVVYFSMGYCSRNPAGNFSIYVRAVRSAEAPTEYLAETASPWETVYFSSVYGKSNSSQRQYTPPPRVTAFRKRPNKSLSDGEVREMMRKYDFYCSARAWSQSYSNPLGQGYRNIFEKLDDKAVIIDHASGLIWQQAVSPQPMTYDQAQLYVASLNERKFAGYNDWRLPTLEEAMSLMERKQQVGDLHLDRIFGGRQSAIWTADQPDASQAWVVMFKHGTCFKFPTEMYAYVRAVR